MSKLSTAFDRPVQRPLVLASGSLARRILLERLGYPFEVCIPGCEETVAPGESCEEVAQRLARTKARAVAAPSNALVIGSDQTAECAGRWLDKPGNIARAHAQLSWCSGRLATFYSGLSVLDTITGTSQESVIITEVRFRTLSSEWIDAYLAREDVSQCAGSFKAEGLGIALFESLQSDDPTALIGLPLISLTTLLLKAGLPPLCNPTRRTL